MKKILRWIGGALFLGFVSLVVAYLCLRPAASAARLVLKNESGEGIQGLRVTVGDEHVDVARLADGDSVDMTFRIFADSEYLITGNYESGSSINEKVGYMARGLYANDVIALSHRGAELRRIPGEMPK